MDSRIVEVKGSNSAYYKAFLADVLPTGVLVTFENNWQPERVIPFKEVRLATVAEPKDDYTEGQEVEVHSKANDNEPCGWWHCRIQMNKGEFFVVEYQCEPKYTEIVTKDRLRPINKSPPFSANMVKKVSLEVPEDLREFCVKHIDAHQEFEKSIGAIWVRYNSQKQKLDIIVSSDSVQRRATIVADLHFRSLRTKLQILQRVEESSKQLEMTQQRAESCVERFSVGGDLMGLAIGTGGANIIAARKIPGVMDIVLDEETHTFTVYGDTQDAVCQAREMLEFCEEEVVIPRPYVGKVIGKKGATIQEMIDKSGVIRVRVVGDDENVEKEHEPGMVPFRFVGIRECIKNAKAMLDYHVAYLRDLDHLRMEQLSINKQIRQLDGGSSSNSGFHPQGESDTDGGSRRRRYNSNRGRGGRRQNGSDREGVATNSELSVSDTGSETGTESISDSKGQIKSKEHLNNGYQRQGQPNKQGPKKDADRNRFEVLNGAGDDASQQNGVNSTENANEVGPQNNNNRNRSRRPRNRNRKGKVDNPPNETDGDAPPKNAPKTDGDSPPKNAPKTDGDDTPVPAQ